MLKSLAIRKWSMEFAFMCMHDAYIIEEFGQNFRYVMGFKS